MSFLVCEAPHVGRFDVSEQGRTGVSANRWKFIALAHNADTHIAIGRGPDRSIDVALDGYLSNLAALCTEWGLSELETAPAALIGELFARRGASALEMLFGSYALCVAEQAQGTLLAARDRVGGRTLYWRRDGTSCSLSTRVSKLAAAGRDAISANPEYFAHRFALKGSPPAGSSAFLGCTELLPGEVLTIDDCNARSIRLPVRHSEDHAHPSTSGHVETFRSTVEAAVAATLPSEGKVACMLSGGLDSGPMAAFAARLLAPQRERLRLVSWSLRDYPKADESSWILQIQERLNIPLTILDGSKLLPFSRFDSDSFSPELPAYNAFRPLMNLMYQAAANEGCSVVLNGFAGDELYPPPRLLYADALARGDFAFVASDICQIARTLGLRGLRHHSPLRYLLRRKRRPDEARPAPSWLTAEAAMLMRPEAQDSSIMAHRFPDYAMQLLGPAMAFGRAHEQEFPNRFGVVRRDPYHDENLIAFMLRLPFSYSFRAGQTKWIMREASRGMLPSAVRRKKRTGRLNTFYSAGLTHNREKLSEFLFDQQSLWADYVRPESLRQALKDDGSVPVVLVSSCLGAVLWANHWKLSRLM